MGVMESGVGVWEGVEGGKGRERRNVMISKLKETRFDWSIVDGFGGFAILPTSLV